MGAISCQTQTASLTHFYFSFACLDPWEITLLTKTGSNGIAWINHNPLNARLFILLIRIVNYGPRTSGPSETSSMSQIPTRGSLPQQPLNIESNPPESIVSHNM